MRGLWMAAVAVVFGGLGAGAVSAADVTVGGLKAAVPAAWKAAEKPGTMRSLQFTVPKADGDKEDADISVFELKAAGTVDANLKRQLAKFTEDGRKEKVDKLKVGGLDATYQDVTGTFLKKAFPMAEKGTPMAGYRQIYVVWENKDGEQVYIWLLGPAKTVEANKKAFDEFLKALK